MGTKEYILKGPYIHYSNADVEIVFIHSSKLS